MKTCFGLRRIYCLEEKRRKRRRWKKRSHRSCFIDGTRIHSSSLVLVFIAFSLSTRSDIPPRSLHFLRTSLPSSLCSPQDNPEAVSFYSSIKTRGSISACTYKGGHARVNLSVCEDSRAIFAISDPSDLRLNQDVSY